MSKHFYTDGIKTIKLEDGDVIPEGFYKGRTFKSNPWNKGLTKEDDERIAQNASAMRETRIKDGTFVSWNTGLTKETNESLKIVSEKVSKARKGKPSWNKGIPATEEQKRKQSEAMQGKTSWNKGLTKETNDSVRSTSEKMLGHECFVSDWEEAKRKEYETRRENGTFCTSKPEDDYYESLCNKYGKDDIIRQYFDKDRYPFKCDFYIKSIDTFIEYNGNWTHGDHPFNAQNPDDVELLLKWKELSEHDNGYYKGAVYTWSVLDVKKLQTLRNNRLNFIIIYPQKNLIIQE